MAGDIKGKYGASATFTVTNLHSLASSQTWEAGWTSAAVDSASEAVIDYLVGATFTTHASNRQAGSIKVFAYAALNDTPTWPDVFSSGTEGTEGAATVHDTEQRDGAMALIADLTVDNTASDPYPMRLRGINAYFETSICPQDWALFIAQNASTTTTAGLAASGSAVYRTPVLAQYT